MSARRKRVNPKKLNALQLRTLAVLQLLAADPAFANPPDEDGSVLIRGLPDPHGDHFHLTAGTVRMRDATGLHNPAVYGALVRKGLVLGGMAGMPVLTREGLAYETGLGARILHRGCGPDRAR